MKTFSTLKITTFKIILVLFLYVFNCKSDKKENTKIVEDPIQEEVANPQFIKITTKSMEFICPDTIPSDWNTFKYYNLSNETHFFLMDKYPEGKTIDDTIKEVGPPFADGMA